MPRSLTCRGCGATSLETFVDLGSSPLSNAYLNEADLDAMEATFPLHARLCRACYLVQVSEFESPESIFNSDYAYFSSYSDTWLEHSRTFAAMAIEKLRLDASSLVVEVASNDGYLLQYFAQAGIPVRGIEPALSVAEAARARGVPTETFFLGTQSGVRFANTFGGADLVAANNVIAHVPDLHDFVGGLAALLRETGVLTVEFPHVQELLANVQFDTIYHEHFSYLSLLALEPILAKHGLAVFDVQRLATHGGSLRVWAAPASAGRVEMSRVREVRDGERAAGLATLDAYASFAPRVHRVKQDLLEFLIQARREGKTVAAYGAAAKGNTLLNYCGVRDDMLAFVVDRNPNKAGRWMPGSRIPIDNPDRVFRERPDYLLVLPWNIKEEVMEQMSAVRDYGGRFVVAIPHLTVFE